jgi:PucR family transcriptional regulator, purine catabolism regulatory protein
MPPTTISEVSLSELVRLAFPAGTPAPTGPARDRTVKWVVMAGEGVRPEPGDLVLCGGTVPPRSELTAWSKRGIVGLVALPSAIPSSADTDLPVIVLTKSASLRDIQQASLQLIVNRQSYLLDRGTRIYRSLAQHAIEGSGLEVMAQAILELTGKSALVQDKRLKPLAQAVAPALAAKWPEMVEFMGAWGKLPEGLRDRRQAAQGGWRDQSLPEGLKRLVCPIVAKGMARGYLSLVGPADELDLLDQLVVEHGAAACALEMAKAKAVSDAEKRARGDFVDAVITGALPLDELLRWALRISYDIEPLHVAVVWRWSDSAGAPSLRRLETLVNQSVVQQAMSALVRPRGNEVVAFCAMADSGRPEAALALAETVQHAATDEYPTTPLFCGVGRSVADVLEWKDSYREATQALSMSIRLHEQRPLHFGDLSVYRLLFQLESNPELEAFCSEMLGPLLDYAGSGDLLVTLEAFCERLGNLSQTAEKLFIHRNTLLYRMERIAQLTGRDMNNPDTRLAVHLALKVRKMLS